MIFTPPPDDAAAAAYRWVDHVAGVDVTRSWTTPDVEVSRGPACGQVQKLPPNVVCLWNVNTAPGRVTTVVLGYRVGKWETRKALLTAAGWPDRRIAALIERTR